MGVCKAITQFISVILCSVLVLFLTSVNFERELYSTITLVDGEKVTNKIDKEPADIYSTSEEDEIYSGMVKLPSEEEMNTNEDFVTRYLIAEKMKMLNHENVFSFAGDCTLGTMNGKGKNVSFYRYLRESGSDTYPFDKTKKLFENDALTLINFEGTLTEATVQANKTFRFKGEPSWAKTMIKASSIESCTIANNHSFDYLAQGFEDTKNALREAGVLYTNDENPIITEVNGMQTVILSGNYINDGISQGMKGEKLTKHLCAEIEKYKKKDNIVMVVCHWGTERETSPNKTQRNSAHAFIDSGADLVVGHHPHTLQGIEQYKGKYIAYSLGNFAFAGNASVSSLTKPCIILRPRAAVVDSVLQITGLSVVPCYTSSHESAGVNNYCPEVLFGEEAKKVKEYILSLNAKIPGGLEDIEVLTTEITEEEN